MAGRRQNGEGSVYQRGRRGGQHLSSQPGQWVAIADLGWRDGKRDRREFTGVTAAEAKRKRERFLATRREGFTLPRGRPPTVADWMTHWLYNIARPKVDPGTWDRSYKSKAEAMIIPFLGGVQLAELDVETLEAWHASLQRTKSKRTGKVWSASTIGQAHRILSAALNIAVARKRIPYNPCGLATPPMVTRKEPRPLTVDQTKTVLRRCETWPTGDRWIVAIVTGMRQGESLGQCWPHVHFSEDGDKAAIRVDEELSRRRYEHGCDEEEPCGLTPRRCPQRTGGLVLKPVKSAKSHRWVVVGRRGTAALVRQQLSQAAAREMAGDDWAGWEHGDLVWAGPAGQPIDARADWQDWQDLLADCGIDPARVHDVRHGLATVMLEEHVEPRVVQEFLGHSSVSFTMDTYTQVREGLLDAAAAAIDRAFGD